MATLDEVESELKGLTKPKLIQLIMCKHIPDDISISDKVMDYIVSVQKTRYSDSSCEYPNDHVVNQKVMLLSCDLKIAKSELVSSNRIINQLEKTILDKEEIINLLKSRKNINSSIDEESAIAISPTTQVVRNKDSDKAIPTADTNFSKKPDKAKIVGNKSTSESLVAAPKKWIFASKYRTTYTKENLTEYLKTEFPTQLFEVEQLNRGGLYNSFKVGVHDDMFDIVLKPEVWPNGIEVSPYLFRPKSATYGNKHPRNKWNSNFKSQRPQYQTQGRRN